MTFRSRAQVQAELDRIADEEAELRHARAVSTANGRQLDNPVQVASLTMAEARLAVLEAQRRALPEPDPVDAGDVVAELVCQRASATVLAGPLPVQVRVTNRRADAVAITALQLTCSPSGALLPAPEHYVTPKLLAPGDELHLPTSIAFIAPGSYDVGAIVTLADGAQVIAAPSNLTGRPVA